MKPTWSTNQLKRLGDALRDGTEPPGALPDYDEVITWYDRLAAETHAHIAAMDEPVMSPVRAGEVTSRAKTVETLRDKLRREWPIRLPSVQDLAGVRVVADMSLTRQSDIARAIALRFQHDHDAIRDLRATPHSGYRAVHVWLRLDEGRVEVQLRTLLQNAWANAYETLADLAGRQIRYGGDPDWVEGTPTDLRDFAAPRPEQTHDLASGLRLLSEENVTVTETLRDFVEAWWDRGTKAVDVDGAVAVSLQLMESQWNIAIKDRAMPEIDLADPLAFEPALESVLEIQDATETMFSSMREGFERIRREIEEGPS